MEIICLGLSHHTAPIDLRERLSYDSTELPAALARFGSGQPARPAGVNELVILSTCNRLELYAAVSTGAGHTAETGDRLAAAFAWLLQFIAETRQVSLAELDGRFYRLAGWAAVEHLGRVAAGLESMVLGEPQILGQVTQAFTLAAATGAGERGAAGPVLSALFRAAIHAGKRARAETGIGRNAATVSSVAVKLAERTVGSLADRHVLVVGAGEMAELAVEALRARAAAHITVVNRSPARAAALTERWGACALPIERLSEALAEADIAISSTDAPHYVISLAGATAALAGRLERPLVLIDIAVPRDVDPAVRQLPGVHYYDLDDLEAHLNGTLAERRQAVPQVEAIVAEEMHKFADWLRSVEITPLIAELHAKAETLMRAELAKTWQHLPQLDSAEREQIEILARSLVNKLLNDPTRRLKTVAGNGHAAEYAAAVRDLFALDG